MDTLTTYKIELYDKGCTIGDKLKYHRLNARLSQDKLAEIIGLSKGACIKNFELNQNYISRKTSRKLADYFSIGTKYFYDEYLEVTDNASEILKKYRFDNNLSISQICDRFNISKTAWRNWENSTTYVGRESYLKLKKIGVFK